MLKIPSYGFFPFESEEDTYNLNDSASIVTKGVQNISNGYVRNTNGVAVGGNPQEVLISCKNKRKRVSAILSEGIKLESTAEWTEMFGGGITSVAGSAIDTVNQITQLSSGNSIQQPWMNRKFYKSTKPFSFSFGINFVAENNAEEEVWKPVVALLSFTFPRDMKQPYKKNGDKGLVGAIADSLSYYKIPGPSLSYDGESSNSNDKGGDAVTLTIGNQFAMGGVYLEKVSTEFSSAYDSSGFPLACKVNITATCMDVNSCTKDGDFLISQFAGNQEDISAAVQQLDKTVKELGEGLNKIKDAVIGFYKA